MVLIRMFPESWVPSRGGRWPHSSGGFGQAPREGVLGSTFQTHPSTPIPVSHPPLLLTGTAPSLRSEVVPGFAVKSWGPPCYQARPCYPLSPPTHHHGGGTQGGSSQNSGANPAPHCLQDGPGSHKPRPEMTSSPSGLPWLHRGPRVSRDHDAPSDTGDRKLTAPRGQAGLRLEESSLLGAAGPLIPQASNLNV